MSTAYLKPIALAFSATLVAASAAFATDAVAPIPVPPVVRAAPPLPWSGCYLGTHVGWGFGSEDFGNPAFAIFAPVGESFHLDTNGVFVGGQIGCNRETASGLVLGIETSGSWANITGKATDNFTITTGTREGTVTTTEQWLESTTVRAGHAFNNLLVYGKGGVAFTGSKYRYTGQFTCSGLCIGPNPAPFDLNGDDIRVGWTLGAGVEWALANRPWSVRVEYDYTDFGTRRVTFYDPVNGLGIFGAAGVPVDITQRLQTVSLAFNRKF